MENEIKVTLDDGSEITCFILDTIEHNNINYILVVEEDEDSDEATIMKEIKMDDDYVTYEFIESDDEFNTIIELFNDNDDYSLL